MLEWQKAEITGHHIYLRLASIVKDHNNRGVFEQIAADEMSHYQALKKHTGQDVAPKRIAVILYYWTARVLGLTFGTKLMERMEHRGVAPMDFVQATTPLPELEAAKTDEEKHEQQLLSMLDEDALKYAGSVVLGLNDALVELTGALAGLTLAFQDTALIALAGLITGISASFSMAASEYLSARAEEGESDPIKSCIYTGIAYILTVVVLIVPYLVLEHYMACLAWTLLNAIIIIAVFNYYLAVAKHLPFGKRFLEMAGISMGVAAFSFVVGYFIRELFGIEV